MQFNFKFALNLPISKPDQKIEGKKLITIGKTIRQDENFYTKVRKSIHLDQDPCEIFLHHLS